MAEIKVKIQSIQNLETKSKVVEEKEEGEVIDRHLITTVKFEGEFDPRIMASVLYALAGGQSVDVFFSSPQFELGILEKETDSALAKG